MQWTQNYDDEAQATKSPAVDSRMKDFSVTRAAVIYVAALLFGGLGILSLFLFAHSSLVIAGSALAIVAALGGALYAVRAVVNGLRA